MSQVTLDQAVYTSLRGERGAGYQLAGYSAGVSAAECRELTQWGPSHDSLLEPCSPSINFHTLHSGRYCLSRTLVTGGEYSGRGAQVYTQVAILAPEQLAGFGWHPFAVARALTIQGDWAVYDDVPARLPALRLLPKDALEGLSAAQLAKDLVGQFGHEAWTAVFRTLALDRPVAIAASEGVARMVAALFSCLPAPLRAELTFTTGLKWSPLRNFRLMPWPQDASERRRLQRAANPCVVELEDGLPVQAGCAGNSRKSRRSDPRQDERPAAASSAWADLLQEVSRRQQWPEFVEWLESATTATFDDALDLSRVDELAPQARAALDARRAGGISLVSR